MEAKTKEIITFSLIGIAAYIFADTIHEVIGHSLACLIIGQHITLLTSVYFRSTPGSVITDLGGPIANLIFGLLIFFVLKHRENMPILTMFLLLLLMAYNFFWFSGTILQSSFSKTGDWTYAIKELNIGSFGKPLLIIVGIDAYYLSIRLIGTHFKKFSSLYPGFPLKQSIFYSYIAAVAAAAIAGLFFSPDRIHAAFEGLLEMIGSIPILFMVSRKKVKLESLEIKPDMFLNATILVLFIIFCLTLGRGFVL